jgi:F-type H+-transporting ATPase subunit b
MFYLMATLQPTPTPTPQSNPLAPDGGELIIGAVAFLIVFAVLARVLLPRIAKTLEERADAIDGGQRRAEDAQAEAARVLEQYQAELAEARREAARQREAEREQGARIVAENRDQAQAEARQIIQTAHAQIEAERQQALATLHNEVGDIAVELASRVIGEQLQDTAAQRGTVERFLAEAENKSSETAGAETTR